MVIGLSQLLVWSRFKITRPVETIPGVGGGDIKENGGGGEFQLWYSVRTCVNVRMFPQYNNKNI
jgi:hypothetical protein